MFKKISLLAAGAAAEYSGTSKDIPLCTAQASTVTVYTASIMCTAAVIKLEGGDPPADNEKTDGYKATMSLKFLQEVASSTVGLFYGICVIPVAKTGADDTAYQKAPRGMCLGINACQCSTGAVGAYAAVNNQTGVLGGLFYHNSYANIVTNSAAKTDAEFTAKSISLPGDDAAIQAQTSALLTPTGATTMAGNIIYGALTIPAAAWYVDSTTTATGAAGFFSHTDVQISETTAAATATWWMPTEAETYADVPRLSPLDDMGWQAYSPDIATSAGYGKMDAQLLVANTSIVDNFATTVAAGVAFVGAAALSF